jgi:hypothetical protein
MEGATMKGSTRLLTVMLAAVGLAAAQEVISAKAGLIHYVQGRVLLDSKAVEPKFGSFPQMHAGSQLRTEEGRAEVLLTPGVFMWVGENSSWRLVSDRLADTRVEVLGGSALIECIELPKENSVTLLYQNAVISLRKGGLYRLNTDPAELRVMEGQAEVQQGGQFVAVKKGRLLTLDGTLLLHNFDTKTGDTLSRWSRQRAEALAMVNVSAARSIWQSGQQWRMRDWYWNPYFGMFTYMPLRGVYRSFWGYSFWSPRQVYVVFQPPQMGGGMPDASRSYNRDLGYTTVSSTSAGTSGTIATSSAPTAASQSSTASIPRQSSQAGGKGR